MSSNKVSQKTSVLAKKSETCLMPASLHRGESLDIWHWSMLSRCCSVYSLHQLIILSLTLESDLIERLKYHGRKLARSSEQSVYSLDQLINEAIGTPYA